MDWVEKVRKEGGKDDSKVPSLSKWKSTPPSFEMRKAVAKNGFGETGWV